MHRTATLINNIYLSKNLTSGIQSSILVDDLSDHLPCIACINRGGSIYTNNLTLETRKLDKNSIDNIRTDLNQTNWNELLRSDSCVNDYYNTLMTRLLELIDTFAPKNIITVPFKKIKQEPWITFLKSSKWLCKLYKNILSDNANEEQTNAKNNAVYSVN